MTVIIMLTLYRVYWVISVWPRGVAAPGAFVISPSFQSINFIPIIMNIFQTVYP
nr:MAG TPA: hypothetical protein [Caudoviricetes sp.]DAZ55580.1 MAG TPA: hypothetical protein [Caudoviricetes sp.]